MVREKSVYRIVGAYDSETTNYIKDGNTFAFPILHQLGLIDCAITDIKPDNVEDRTHIYMYRHAIDLYDKLDELASCDFGYVPVICCHNLSFDMYGLSQWLQSHEVRVLAKSARKPITFTILDEFGKPRLVIWDTLVFTQTSLERMGKDCGYAKAVGEWDYNLVRTPETPLSDLELDYAKKDVYTLVCYISWFLNRNPDIEPETLACRVTTKTGVVRERRRKRFFNLKAPNRRYNIGKYWLYQNRKEAPKSDDELFTMQACLRGGFTFVASELAGVPFNLHGSDSKIYAYDATSQHPAQIVSHFYPENFHESTPKVLNAAADLIESITFDHVLEKWHKPFNVAFAACFEFVNIRPKKDSVYEQFGILPLASARFVKSVALDDDNGDKIAHDENRSAAGYGDIAVNPSFAFGKLFKADRVRVWLTELAFWEVCRCYDFDSRDALSGYLTGKFCRPTDMAIVSVMQFYKAKNEFKQARKAFYNSEHITNTQTLAELGISRDIVETLENGTISKRDIESVYLSLKADLNALFGIEASNEYRRDTVLNENGIEYAGSFGICNAPKAPKAWYQFGTRVVGWSRIAQLCIIELVKKYAFAIINGDTDSVKIAAAGDDITFIDKQISRLSDAIDKAKSIVCLRVKASYPQFFDELGGIGHYVHEFEADYFCASWNKAYAIAKKDDAGLHYDFTIAGIPAYRGLNELANKLTNEQGYTFEQVCSLLLGYNVTFAHDILGLNARKFPDWGDIFNDTVTDYQGNACRVCEPSALALYPMSKTINDTRNNENYANMIIAHNNNTFVNMGNMLVTSKGVIDFDEFWGSDRGNG